ncbi:YjfI family protein [Kosakonia pseudosacchari]|uniref:DUF2170 family protein n=1 Tax=Kosakonia pseudosacchari TaxID=1646340 RepID=A0ABX4IK13_9ENTR|nr:DUF2170 family protein [Kosakonia pseudosacchari]PDO83683.1 hypothetical protein BK796_20065 [Kosakonia pseudosacchari]QOV66247.1 DUF2170 family protein [Kosakonia pseudosacchari]
MAWTVETLSAALLQSSTLNLNIRHEADALIIKLDDYGDLQLNLLLTSRQIIIETYICPLSEIKQQDAFNAFLLRNQKLLPLSSVGISPVGGEEYYVAFGALSLNSSLDDILLEISTLAQNALDLAELTDDFTQ